MKNKGKLTPETFTDYVKISHTEDTKKENRLERKGRSFHII